MHRFRWMGLYVLVVAVALGCAVLVVAMMRAAVDLPTPAGRGEDQASPGTVAADYGGVKRGG